MAGPHSRSLQRLVVLESRIQRMTDTALPIRQTVVNAAINQTNWGEFAIRRMRGPNRIAASPIRENRIVRAPKTHTSRRTLGYWKALAAAMIAVKGNGGGAIQAITTATPACCFTLFSR